MKQKKENIGCEPCGDMQVQNQLNAEIRIAAVRWVVLAYLFLHVNLLRLDRWPLPLMNGVLAAAALYNLFLFIYLRRMPAFSVGLTILTGYLDMLAVPAAVLLTGTFNSSLLFIWYSVLFVAGARLGFLKSLVFLVPISLLFVFLTYRQPGLHDAELLNRLFLGLFSFVVTPLFGVVFAREKQDVMEIMADIRRDSITDRLTGLFNYSYFMDELHRELSRAERTGSHFSLIIFDLDLFKQVNDTYGHEKGNLLLKDVAAILKTNARQMDTVARYGGEEFVILMPESNGAEMEVAERIRRKIEDAEFAGIAAKPIRITISGGVCTYPKDARSVNELLDKADRGLYLAKTCGRNKTSYCMPMA